MSQNSRKNPSQEITIGFINLITSCQIGSWRFIIMDFAVEFFNDTSWSTPNQKTFFKFCSIFGIHETQKAVFFNL